MRKSLIESSEKYFSREDLKVEYDVDLSHLITLDSDFMCNWVEQEFYGDKDSALDYLYNHNGTRNLWQG
jgi:hypothetical protein